MRAIASALALTLAACGGGGDGGGSTPLPAPAAVSFTTVGALTPPSFVVNAEPPTAIGLIGTPPPANMLFPPGIRQFGLPALCESAQYTLSGARQANAVAFEGAQPCDPLVTIGASAYPGEPSLGQLAGIDAPNGGPSNRGFFSIRFGTGTLSIDNTGPQPFSVLTKNTPPAIETVGYALPRSAALNPTGFTYQSFGRWTTEPGNGSFTDGFFSMGIASSAIPATGSATYAGVGRGTFVSAATGDLLDVRMTVIAQVDFAARSIKFTTSATMPSAVPDLTATLGFPPAINTFFGPTNGVTGHVMGRFYGAPSEIGGTFGAFFPGVGSLIGSFGAQ